MKSVWQLCTATPSASLSLLSISNLNLLTGLVATDTLFVLDAQRTYDDVQAQYIETLFNYCTALVELEKSAGDWDVEL